LEIITLFRHAFKTKPKPKMRDIKKELGLKYQPSRLSDREAAFRYSNHTVKPSIVMLGDDQKFWVVCPADAHRLLRQGFECAG